MMHRIWLLSAIMLNLYLQPLTASPSPAGGAEAVIVSTTETIYRAIKDQCKEIEQDPRQLHRLVEEIILPHADFERMAQWVLGKYWRDADTGHRAEFVSEFRELLIRTYATAIQMASLESIRYLPRRDGVKPNTAVVRIEIRRPGEAMVTINYHLYNKDGDWLVYDILVSGISLVTNYRSTFSEEIRNHGLPGLIKSLGNKNRKPVTRMNADLIKNRVKRVCS